MPDPLLEILPRTVQYSSRVLSTRFYVKSILEELSCLVSIQIEDFRYHLDRFRYLEHNGKSPKDHFNRCQKAVDRNAIDRIGSIVQRSWMVWESPFQ
jgi:hypothetical protein